MKLRVARHTRDLNRISDFYGRILGLKVLGEFKDHHNYNGVFLGLPGTTWHLEFTTSENEPDHHPDEDDLLVFYADSEAEFNGIKDKFITNKVKYAIPKNPYWEKNGLTFTDPDGYRIVLTFLRNAVPVSKPRYPKP